MEKPIYILNDARIISYSDGSWVLAGYVYNDPKKVQGEYMRTAPVFAQIDNFYETAEAIYSVNGWKKGYEQNSNN